MRIRYFAWLKQRVGCAEELLDPVPPHLTSVAALKAFLAERHPGFAEALASRGVIRCAVNHDYVPEDAPLRAGDEVAFFPPVTGG
ncbi:molybdopterin converting factor subunit 1 [Benzoatithermus flavus]|uniref:Molybdopterin synthase sulfur carrier subunit n=1 Tax=Benzoatithermus flavus TaxID=3108223 RepID=A0ABU8XVX3_9PROT